jgi:hypothetical protein
VTLSWETTGGGTIQLLGDGETKNGKNDQTPFKHVDSFPVTPLTTTTYTLKVSLSETIYVIQQVTVTVIGLKTRIISQELLVDLDALLAAQTAGTQTHISHPHLLTSGDGIKTKVNAFAINTGITWNPDEVLIGHWHTPISGFADLAKVRYCQTADDKSIDHAPSRSIGLVVYVDLNISNTTTVTGTVVGPDGAPVAGAIVFSKRDFRTAVTGSDGTFSMTRFMRKMPDGSGLFVQVVAFFTGPGGTRMSGASPEGILLTDDLGTIHLSNGGLDTVEITQEDVSLIQPFSFRVIVNALVSKI